MSRPARRHLPAAADDSGGALARARALGDPTRSAIHHTLAASAQPLTIAELAEHIGVHRTAIGQHLAILSVSGLVERSTRPPAGRGRPVSVYRAISDDPYRTLATWLAEVVSSGRSPREIGVEIGCRMHRDPADEADQADRADHADTSDAVDVVVREASRLGFTPSVHPRRGEPDRLDVVLDRCPFAELAAADPATVCDLHHGVAEGLARCAGGATVDALHVADPHRGGCRITMRRAD